MTQSASDITPYPNPLFYDKIAADLNVKLATLGYIDDMYGITFVGFDGDESFPEIYQNSPGKTNFRVMPDSTKSLSFFMVNGEMTEVDEIGFAIPISLFVWMNLPIAFPGVSYDSTTEVIKAVYNIVITYGGYDCSITVDDVFPEFSQLSKQVAANTQRPYSAFRCDFVKNIQICDF